MWARLTHWVVRFRDPSSAGHSCLRFSSPLTHSLSLPQIPQWCAEFALARGFQTGQVTVTQPYPLAAMSLASRVADEMDLTLGHEIGYSIPQEDCTGPNTMLRFCWDRLFLQEVASTRGPGAWSVLILDEAQERSVASDLLQGLLRDTRLRNLPGDPRVVVVTDPALEPKFQAFWGNSPIVRVPREPGGDPTLAYKDTVPTDLVEAACQAVLELCQQEEAPGDVLVYLPSEEVNERKKQIWEAFLCCFPVPEATYLRNSGSVYSLLKTAQGNQQLQNKEICCSLFKLLIIVELCAQQTKILVCPTLEVCLFSQIKGRALAFISLSKRSVLPQER